MVHRETVIDRMTATISVIIESMTRRTVLFVAIVKMWESLKKHLETKLFHIFTMAAKDNVFVINDSMITEMLAVILSNTVPQCTMNIF